MRLTVTETKEAAEGTKAFLLSPEKPFTFKPGQFGEFALPQGGTHPLSIASAPEEPHIMIATRMRDSPYKNALKALKPGDTIDMMGPMGSFTLRDGPAVLIAGGIGITPIRSMVAHETMTNSDREIVVIYTNRTFASTAFLEDLRGWEESNPHLRVLAALTDDIPDDWTGLRGRVDAETIKTNAPDHATFYIVGPPGMVAGVTKALKEAGVEDGRIVSEDFAGY